jgi:hypothetical protein
MTETKNKEITQADYAQAKKRYHSLGVKAKGTAENSKVRKLYNSARAKYKSLGSRIQKKKDAKMAAHKVSLVEASKLNRRRPKNAQKQDKAKLSKHIARDLRWVVDPAKYDYPGIDTPKKTK